MSEILYNLELEQYVLKYPNGEYVAMSFPMYIPLNEFKSNEESSKERIRQYKIIDDYLKYICEKNNCEIISSHGNTFNIPKMFLNQINYKDLYNGNYYEHQYSKSKVLNYIKYKQCFKKYNRDFVYFTENHGRLHFSNQNNLDETDTIINVVVCTHSNFAFNLDEINKGFWSAVKSDFEIFKMNLNDLWLAVTYPIWKIKFNRKHVKIN